MSSNTNYSGTTQHHNGENNAQLPNGCIFIYFIVILISRRKTLFKRNAVTKGHPAKKKPCNSAAYHLGAVPWDGERVDLAVGRSSPRQLQMLC